MERVYSYNSGAHMGLYYYNKIAELQYRINY